MNSMIFAAIAQAELRKDDRKVQRIVVHMRCFGGESCKPLELRGMILKRYVQVTQKNVGEAYNNTK